MKQKNEVRLDYHFADNATPAFIGVFVTSKEAYETGESAGADDIVQVPVNARDSVVCDLMQDAAESACKAANASSPTSASMALSSAAEFLRLSGKARNPGVEKLREALMAVSKQMAKENAIAVTFESRWEEGVISTDAYLDLDTGVVFDIAVSDAGSEYEHLIGEFVLVGGREVAVELEPDDNYRIDAPTLAAIKAELNEFTTERPRG